MKYQFNKIFNNINLSKYQFKLEENAGKPHLSSDLGL